MGSAPGTCAGPRFGDSRAEVGLPPVVHLAAVDGAPGAVAALLEAAQLPDGADVLGECAAEAGAIDRHVARQILYREREADQRCGPLIRFPFLNASAMACGTSASASTTWARFSATLAFIAVR